MNCLYSKNAPKDQDGLMTELEGLYGMLTRAWAMAIMEAGPLSQLESGQSSRLPALNELLDECDGGLERLGAALGEKTQSIEATPGREMEGLGKDLGRKDCVQTLTSPLEVVNSMKKLKGLLMEIERDQTRLTLKTDSGVETLQEQVAKHSQ
ncbi:hypothetical protein JB92DRAFT_3133292 [Gautieria morchelliformis]|nr:hypothetical protein JB92DRAFT_3133292 [Gautieria morchelliformis]